MVAMTKRRQDRFEPKATTVSWPNKQKGPWAIRVHFDEVGGRTECVKLEIRRKTVEQEPITASLVRAIPVASIIDDARKNVTRNLCAPRKREPRAKSILGRRPLDAELLRAVAEVYTDAWKSGGHPTKAVEAHFDRPYPTAARWISRARKEGFLSPTTRGRPGVQEHETRVKKSRKPTRRRR